MGVALLWFAFFVLYFLASIYAKMRRYFHARIPGTVGGPAQRLVGAVSRPWRLSPRFHHHHLGQVRQAFLSLRPVCPSGSWPELSSDAKGTGQDGDGDLSDGLGTPQGAARSGPVPSLPGALPRTAPRQ